MTDRRIRDSHIPSWVTKSPWGPTLHNPIQQERLDRAAAVLDQFRSSIHPDDREVARIVDSLKLPVEDYLTLVRSLREPGSSNPPHRKKDASRMRAADVSDLQALHKKMGRMLRQGDIFDLVASWDKPRGASKSADTARLWVVAQQLGIAPKKQKDT